MPFGREKRVLTARKTKLAKDGPSKGTRSGTRQTGPTTGHLHQKPVNLYAYPSCPIVVSDGRVSLNGNGRCYDGSDDSIASPVLPQNAILKGIGRFEAIEPVSTQVALTNTKKAESFNFSRLWKVPRLVMELSAGRLAINNVSFLVTDDDLACEDPLIGLPVLRHLGIDSRTLLERNCAMLDGTDCSFVGHPSAPDRYGSLGRLMIARLQRSAGCARSTVTDSDTDNDDRPDPACLALDRPKYNYFSHCAEEDTFRTPTLLISRHLLPSCTYMTVVR